MSAMVKQPGFANSPFGRYLARRGANVGSTTAGGGITPTLVTAPAVQPSTLYGG